MAVVVLTCSNIHEPEALMTDVHDSSTNKQRLIGHVGDTTLDKSCSRHNAVVNPVSP